MIAINDISILSSHKQELAEQGFTVLQDVFTESEVEALISQVESVDSSNATFRKSAELFAIRQFLQEVPQVQPLIFTARLLTLIRELFGADYFLVKSIYFDKPGVSNWFVSYHQDLTITVDRKAEMEGFGPWTMKQNQYGVQPPLAVLENIYTLRIHLDDTDEQNGALRVVPGSHLKGIYRPETIDWQKEKEVTCPVPKGGVMIMRPLLLHASSRTINQQRRRVIHLEFCNQELPAPLHWSERINTMTQEHG